MEFMKLKRKDHEALSLQCFKSSSIIAGTSGLINFFERKSGGRCSEWVMCFLSRIVAYPIER
jgi:hypothetical protein